MKTNHKYELVFYSTTVLLASIIGIIELPETYFSNKYNPLNQFMAKYAWGWTVVVLLPLILSRKQTRSVIVGILLLGLSTMYFLISVKFMNFVHHITGSCSIQNSEIQMNTRSICNKNGGYWQGFDISGHCFLLVHSSLYINHELKLAETRGIQNSIINYVVIGARFILFIWWMMLIFTCFYFHSVSEALLGLWMGIGFWAILYEYGGRLLV